MTMIQARSIHSVARERSATRRHSDFAAIWPILLFVVAGLALTLLVAVGLNWAGVPYDPALLQEAMP